MLRTTKIGCNKGKPRVWIEGAALVETGFQRGDRFDIEISAGSLKIVASLTGKRTVSGKGDRPIIDLATADLLTIAPIGTKLSIDKMRVSKALKLHPIAEE